MKTRAYQTARLPAPIALVLLALFALQAQAQAVPPCSKPFSDRAQEVICSDADAERAEWNLQTQIRALKELLTAFEFEALEKEQVLWNTNRQKICEAEPAGKKAACYEAQSSNRASVLQRQVTGALTDGVSSLSVGYAILDAQWRIDKKTGAVVTQLRHGDQILTEVLGAERFDIVGRAGNSVAEAIVLRSRKKSLTFVIVDRRGLPPEIWRYWPSRSWMKQPPIVEAKGEQLILKELVETPRREGEEMASPAVLKWTPSGGWLIVQPFRIKAVVPKVRQFDGRARPGEDCKPPLKDADTVEFGSHTLEIGTKSDERDYILEPFGPFALAFGCDLLIGSNIHPPSLTAPRQIDGVSIMIGTEASGRTLGIEYRHVLADVSGRGIQVWPFPNSEGEIDNNVDAIATSFGFLFLTPAGPGLEGGVYRWTPTAGYTFDGYRPFTPKADTRMPSEEVVKSGEDPTVRSQNLLKVEEVYRAFAVAAGPSFIGRAYDASAGRSAARIDRRWAPEFIVFSECDGPRRCSDSGLRIFGAFKRETRKFYFAFRQEQKIFRYPQTALQQPSVWEFHPPLEIWPEDATRIFETVHQADEILK